MISEEIIDKVVQILIDRIEEGNTYAIKKIAQDIKKLKTLTPSDAQKLVQILKYGGDYQKITKKLSDITKMNIKDIYKIFESVAKQDQRFAKEFYEYRGIKFIPYEQNKALQNEVKALANITAKNYVNLTNTMAFATRRNGKIVYSNLAKTYDRILDRALLSLSQGKETFDNEVRQVIKDLTENGIKVVEYESGRKLRLDSAIRMQLKDGISQMEMELQKEFGKEFGSDGVEITVHEAPAPDHAEVQGKQFSTNQYDEKGKLIKEGEFEKFQSDREAISYDGTVFPPEHNGRDRRSIGQYNCYHKTRTIILGISKPRYTKTQLNGILKANKEGFDMDGKHYTLYEGTQLQRTLETEIRKAKNKQIAGKEIPDLELIDESQQRITQLTKKYKELSQLSGLTTKPNKLLVPGYKRVKIK